MRDWLHDDEGEDTGEQSAGDDGQAGDGADEGHQEHDQDAAGGADTDGRTSLPPRPRVDAGIEEELDEGEELPEWFGIRWRDIPVGEQREAWIGLRRWVDWFTDTHRLGTSVIPSCWFQHSGIVEELYAAMCLEWKVWALEAPNVSPVTMWHNYRGGIIDRLTAATSRTGCEEGGHKPEHEMVREVDDFEWERVISRREVVQTVDHPEKGVRWVRAKLLDQEGDVVTQSKPVGLSARQSTDPIHVTTEWGAVSGWVDEQVRLVVTNGHRVEDLMWEHSDDDGATWRTWDDADEADEEGEMA